MTARSSSSGSTSGHGNKQKSCLMCIKLKRTDLRCLARVRVLLSLGGPALLRAKQWSHSLIYFRTLCSIILSCIILMTRLAANAISSAIFGPDNCNKNLNNVLRAAWTEPSRSTDSRQDPRLQIYSFQATASTHNNRPYITTRGGVWLHYSKAHFFSPTAFIRSL